MYSQNLQSNIDSIQTAGHCTVMSAFSNRVLYLRRKVLLTLFISSGDLPPQVREQHQHSQGPQVKGPGEGLGGLGGRVMGPSSQDSVEGEKAWERSSLRWVGRWGEGDSYQPIEMLRKRSIWKGNKNRTSANAPKINDTLLQIHQHFANSKSLSLIQ